MLVTRVDEITEERLRTGLGTNLKSWHIPQCPFLMECSSAVLEQIRREAEAGRDSPRGEREIGGVLFGIQEPGRIGILACKPLQCEYAMGSGFVLSEKDEKRLRQLISAPGTEPELNGLQVLGWYHSHVRSPIFLSKRDQQIHSRYFAGPYQVALVIRPKSERPGRAGFFFREASGEMRTESSYEEFTLETSTPAASEAKQAVVSKRAPSQKWTSSPAKIEQQQREPICPKCGSRHLRRSRRTGAIERFREFFGYYPYRCHECLSRSFLKTASGILESARPSPRRRAEERKRARDRTRREILLWGAGILGFLAILRYLVRDSGPKPDAP